MKVLLNVFAIIIVSLASCSNSIKPEELYGRWNYVKVDNTNPQDTLPEGELELQSPAIIFNKDHTLVIEWGGKKLSSGTFKMDGRMIRYNEALPNNQRREFPFLIKSLSEKELVFQTMIQSSTVVTAVRVTGNDNQGQ